MIHQILQGWFGLPNGAVYSNLVAAIIWVPVAWIAALRHLHCIEKGCYRPATVPVPGTVHKICKKHAPKLGVTH
jgi:hypothetical protein